MMMMMMIVMSSVLCQHAGAVGFGSTPKDFCTSFPSDGDSVFDESLIISINSLNEF